MLDARNAGNGDHDVAIVGGGTAGLSAALLLGRARRRVCVLDAGHPRNLPAPESHSLFTRDGTPPGELVRIGREQLTSYPTVDLVQETVASARAEGQRFELTLSSGRTLTATKLILATGVRDVLPEIPGLTTLWGKSVFHCPYCHGYEARDAPIGIILGEQDDPIALAQLIRGWSHDLILFSNGRTLRPDVQSELSARGVKVRDGRVASFVHQDGRLKEIVLDDKTRVSRAAALLRPPQATQSALAAQLGCRMTTDGLIEVGPELETSVPNVFAAGDCIRRLQQLVFAAADGATAATSVNKRLLAEDWAREAAPSSPT